jgi:ketosteroid isomerase-like protein
MGTPKQAALDEIRLAIARTNNVFASEVVGKRNFSALDQVYTADARILPPGSPMVSGRPAIKKFWSDLVQSANAKSAMLTSVDVMSAGEGLVEIGRAVLTVEPEGQPSTQMEVKYVVYWRQEDGRWKWYVDIWNQNAQ